MRHLEVGGWPKEENEGWAAWGLFSMAEGRGEVNEFIFGSWPKTSLSEVS